MNGQDNGGPRQMPEVITMSPNEGYDVHEVQKVPPEEVIASLRTILKRFYHAPNNEFELYHELRFAIEANLLHLAKYTVSEVLYIMNNLAIVDVTYEKLKSEISYIAEHGYVYPTYASFEKKVRNSLTFVSKDQKKEYTKMLKRLWELLQRLAEANREVSKTYALFKAVINGLSEGLKHEKLFKKILLSAKDVTFFGQSFIGKDGEEGIKAYASIIDLAEEYLKRINKSAITKDDLKDFVKFAKEEIKEVAVFHDYLLMIDFDSEDKNVNLKGSIEVFEKIKGLGAEMIYHSTGGKGAHILVFFPVTLDKEKLNVLKSIAVREINKVLEEVAEKYNAKIELIDGSNKALSLWYGRHRKTGQPKEILGYQEFSYKDLKKTVEDILCKEIIQIGELPVEFRSWTLDMLLLLYDSLKSVRVEDKRTIMNKVRSFMEDLEDDEYKIPSETIAYLKAWEEEDAFLSVEKYEMKEFEKRYGFRIDEDVIKELKRHYSEKHEGLPESLDVCVFDFETRNTRFFAFEPVMATFFFPQLQRITIWISDGSDKVEEYRGRRLSIRVVRTKDPEILLGAVFPEWILLGVMKKYQKFGSYLYGLDIRRFNIYAPKISYLREFIKKPRPLYLVGFNLGFDFPILMDLLKDNRKGTVLTEELSDGDLITINLYDGEIPVLGRIRVARSSTNNYTKVSMKIGDQYIKGLDVADLGRFWATKSTLKALSHDFNKFFTKIGDFDIRLYEKWEELKKSPEFSKTIKYNVYDVLSTYELLFALIPYEIKQEFKDFAYVIESDNLKKVISASKLIELKDFIQIVSGATIPKKIYERLIESLDAQKYRNNSLILNSIFNRFYYGGRVYCKVGKAKDVKYVDFASEYPHIMNYLFIENIMANLALFDLEEVFKTLDDPTEKSKFLTAFQDAVDAFVTNISNKGVYRFIAEFARNYPQGIFYITPFRPKDIDLKVSFKKKGRYSFNSHNFNLSLGAGLNNPRADIHAKGQFTVDLPLLLLYAIEWRLKNRNEKWKNFWKKEIRIDWTNSAVFKAKQIINPIRDYEAYGVKSYAIPHYALHIRQRYKQLKKEAKENGNKDLEKLYDKKQWAFKILANSAYGATAEENWKYLNKMISSAITGFGRLQQRIIQLLGEYYGIDMVYGDTDSAMLRVSEDKHEEFEKIRAVFEGIDNLEIEAELEVLEVFASKNYRFKRKGKDKWETKVHGKGAYNAFWKGKKVFEKEFFNKVYEYLEGNDEAKDYGEPSVMNINLRAKEGFPAIVGKLVKYSKKKEEMIRNYGFYVEKKYLTTHILPEGASVFGKFFKVLKVSGSVKLPNGEKTEIEYVITAFYSDEEIEEFLNELGLKLYERRVYDIVKSRLENIRKKLFLNAKELSLQSFRKAFEEGFMIAGKIPEVSLSYRPIGIKNYLKQAVKRHSTEWILIGKLEKPTAYYFDVRHFSKAFANLYLMDKRLVGSGWIDKTIDEVVFRYKITEDGELEKATKDDDAHVIIRVPLKAYDVKRNPSAVKVNQDYLTEMQYKVLLTINAPEPKPLSFHRAMKSKAFNRWLKNLEPYLQNYIDDFAQKSVSTDIFQRLYDSIAVKKVLDAVIEDIKERLKSDVLLLKEHLAEDFEVSKDLSRNIEFVLSQYNNIIREVVLENIIEAPTSVKKIFALTKMVDSSGLHLQAKGLRISLYNHTYSKLGRLESRFRRDKTVRAFKTFETNMQEVAKQKSVIYRIELEADRNLIEAGLEIENQKLDVIDIFNRIKVFFKKVMDVARVINELQFKLVYNFIAKVFESTVNRLLEFIKHVRAKGRAALSCMRRYTSVLITLLAADHDLHQLPLSELWKLAKGMMHRVGHELSELYAFMYKERLKNAHQLYQKYKKGLDLDPLELDDDLKPSEQVKEVNKRFSIRFNPDWLTG